MRKGNRMHLEHALDYFLHHDRDEIAVAVEEILGIPEGEAIVEIDRGYTARDGFLTGGDLHLVHPAGGWRKLTTEEMIAVAVHMGAGEWNGPSFLDQLDHGIAWR